MNRYWHSQDFCWSPNLETWLKLNLNCRQGVSRRQSVPAILTDKRLTNYTISHNKIVNIICRLKGYNIAGIQKHYHTVEKPLVKMDYSGKLQKLCCYVFIICIFRSEFGKMLMTIQEVQTLHEIYQLKMKSISSTRFSRRLLNVT